MNDGQNALFIPPAPAPKPHVPDATLDEWQHVVDLLAQIVGVPAALVMRLHPPHIDVLVTSHSDDNPFHVGERVALDSGPYCKTVVEERTLLLVPDARKDPLWDDNPDLEVGMVSYLGLPLLWPDGEVFGTICVLDSKENAYTQTYRDLLHEFRSLIEMHLRMLYEVEHHLQTEERLAWEMEVHEALSGLSGALITHQSIDEISYLILEHAKRLTGSEFGYVGYLDPLTGNLISSTMTRDIWEMCQVENKDVVFRKFSGLWGWVLDNRQPLLTNDPGSDPRSTGTPDGHLPIHRFLSAPAVIGDELVGQVALANSGRDYTERDLHLVERLASLYALAVQRTRVEKALRESEEKYRSLFEHAGDAIFILDPDTRCILDANPQAVDLLGYSYPRLTQLTLEALDASGATHTSEELLRELHDTGSLLFEHVYRHKEGAEIPVEINARLIEYGDRPVIVSFVRDVSERKRMEEARRREMRTLEQLSGPPSARVTAAAFGQVPLQKASSHNFDTLAGRYAGLMDQGLERRFYKVELDLSEDLRLLAEQLGRLGAGPRDVVELHVRALKDRTKGVPPPKAQLYTDEGRLMLLELMGYLASYYRNRSENRPALHRPR